MKSLLKTSISLLSICSFNVFATIETTVNLNQIERTYDQYLSKYNPERILSAWDVDLVLIQPQNPALQMSNIIKHKKLFKKLFSTLSSEEKVIALNLSTKYSPPTLVEQQTPAFIKNLQEKGVKTIGLTASLTGSLLQISSIEEHRVSRLKELGYNFESSFPSLEKIIFSEMPAFRQNYPTFLKGILHSNASMLHSNKGESLVNFLKKSNYTPELIIFVDDKMDFLVEVETSLKMHFPSIEYIGLHYTYTKNSQTKSISEKEFISTWEKIINLSTQANQ